MNPVISGARGQSSKLGALCFVVARLLAEVTCVVQAPSKTFGCFSLQAFTFAIALAFARFALAFSFTLAFAFGAFSEKKRIPTFG